MKKGNWKAAYNTWWSMDTAARDKITNDAYDLLMSKSGYMAKGGNTMTKKRITYTDAQIEKIIREYEQKVNSYYLPRYKHWRKSCDCGMMGMEMKNKNAHLQIVEDMKNGNWIFAYNNMWWLKTSARDIITKAAYDLITRKVGLRYREFELYKRHKSGRKAKGGMLEHGLRGGDKIVAPVHNAVLIKDKDSKDADDMTVVNLNTGKRKKAQEIVDMPADKANAWTKMAKGGKTKASKEAENDNVKLDAAFYKKLNEAERNWSKDAGGLDKTCKSNADSRVAIFLSRSGARVRNTWAICREAWNNLLKSGLMPDVTAGGIPLALKVGDRKA